MAVTVMTGDVMGKLLMEYIMMPICPLCDPVWLCICKHVYTRMPGGGEVNRGRRNEDRKRERRGEERRGGEHRTDSRAEGRKGVQRESKSKQRLHY